MPTVGEFTPTEEDITPDGSMREHLDTLKVWLISIGGGLLTLTEALGTIFSTLGAAAAMVYTIYKLVILHRDNKKKSK
jgi:hypothetical protein